MCATCMSGLVGVSHSINLGLWLSARATASHDGRAAEAILASCIRESAALPWGSGAGGEPAWPNERCEALSTMFHARVEPDFLKSPEHLERIERVALGFGKLPHIFRVQAAWLALKSRGEGRRLIAQLMTETDSTD